MKNKPLTYTNFIVTSELTFDKLDIQKAKKWEADNKLDYRDDLSHLLLDCHSVGVIKGDILKVEGEYQPVSKVVNS